MGRSTAPLRWGCLQEAIDKLKDKGYQDAFAAAFPDADDALT
ncbi:hypothetical protein P4S70_07610 [Enterovibrio sp. Hal110]